MDINACRIRAMVTDDLERVVALEETLQSHPWRRGHFENCLAIGNLAWVVEIEIPNQINRPIIAFAIVSLGGGEAELLNIGVDSAYQRRGIAEDFLGDILEFIKPRADTIFLEVRVSNHRAIALYDKIGFNQVGVRPNYYAAAKGREDALLYAMSLL